MELRVDDDNLCLGVCSPKCSTFGTMEGVMATAEDDVLDDRRTRVNFGMGGQTVVRGMGDQGHCEWH